MEGEGFWEEEEKTGRGTNDGTRDAGRGTNDGTRDAGHGTNKFTIYEVRFTIERLQAVLILNHLTLNT